MFSTKRVVIGPDEYRIEVSINEFLRTEINVSSLEGGEREAKLRATEDILKRQLRAKILGGEKPDGIKTSKEAPRSP